MLNADIRFVSAQPDRHAYVWQTHVYLHNFLAKGVHPDQCVALFGTDPSQGPSQELRDLQQHFAGVDTLPNRN